MSRTTKPCPGCGEVHPYRPAAEVCGDCEAKFEELRVLKQSIRQAIENGHLVVANLHGAWHWQPYITGPNRDDVQKLFLELCEAVSQRTWRETSEGHFHYGILDTEGDKRDNTLIVPKARNDRKESGDNQCMLPSHAANILPKLYQAISDLADSCYLEGHQKGRDLLMSLHSGELTMADFEDRAFSTDKRYG